MLVHFGCFSAFLESKFSKNCEKPEKVFENLFFDFLFVFLVICLQKLFFILLIFVWLSNIPNHQFLVQLLLSHHVEKNVYSLKKNVVL